jgi:hypothetical protein
MTNGWVKDNRAYFDALAAGKDPTKMEDNSGKDKELAALNWDGIVSNLVRYSLMDEKDGKYGYPKDTPEYETLEKLKKFGKDAYPYLVQYIDNENLNWAKGAVVALRNLTGISTPLPKNPEDQKRIKAQWMKELGIKQDAPQK